MRLGTRLVSFLKEHSLWFSIEALVIVSFMIVHLGLELDEAALDIETCVRGLACGAYIGGTTTAIVAFTALLMLTALEFSSPRD